MGNFKVYTTFNKSLGQTAPYAICQCRFPKADNLPIIQKVMPIILTLFSTKCGSYYSQIILGI